MRRFLMKMSGFALLQVAILSLLFVRARLVDESDYMAATIDKHARAESLSGPRMLVIGGSNVSFGVDSVALENAFGMPTVNMGLNADLGADFMLAEAEDVARTGDVLLVSLEYEHFVGTSTTATVIMRLFEHRPESIEYVSPRQHLMLLDSGLPYIHSLAHRGIRFEKRRKRSTVTKKNAYLRSAFNDHGDLVGHESIPAEYDPKKAARSEMQSMWQNGVVSQIDHAAIRDAVNRLDSFVKRCEARGVRVFLATPPRAETSASRVRPVMDAVNAELAQRKSAPIVTDARSVVLPDSHFFDSCYHLTGTGKHLRTRLLIEGLSGSLPRVDVPSNPTNPPDYLPPRPNLAEREEGIRRQ